MKKQKKHILPALNLKQSFIAVSAGIVILTAFLYRDVHTFDFLSYDDDLYITANPAVQQGMSWESVRWAFTATRGGAWQPLVWLSFVAEYSVFGLHPGGYHVVNALLHVAASLLLLLLLHRLTGRFWESAFVALLFAVHPVHVESVAWVAERKDVLSGLFFMLTLLAYTAYVRNRTMANYLLTFVLYILGLTSKPMLVTLPLIMLALDYWPLRRTASTPDQLAGADRKTPPSWKALVIEKLPFFLLSLAVGILALATQSSTESGASSASVVERIAAPLSSLYYYCLHIVFPINLSFLYPRPADVDLVATFSGMAILVVFIATAALFRKRNPAITAGIVWFLIMLAPVLGLVQFGIHAYADRFLYLPRIGLFIAVLWAAGEAARKSGGARSAVRISAAVILFGLVFLSSEYIAKWKNDNTLYAHALTVNPKNPIAHLNLGIRDGAAGNYERGLSHLLQAVAFDSSLAIGYFNIGQIHLRQGRLAEAEQAFHTALSRDSSAGGAYIGLGNVYAQAGRFAEAEQAYLLAVQRDPTNVHALINLAEVAHSTGRNVVAGRFYQAAYKLQPNNRSIIERYGLFLSAIGEKRMARPLLEGAWDENAPSLRVSSALAEIHFAEGNGDSAVMWNNRALLLDPQNEHLQKRMLAILENLKQPTP